MNIDPLRLAIALVPLAGYLAVLGLINLRRRPMLVRGGNDLAALGIALSGVVFVGPLELFYPEAARAQFGNYVWFFLLAFYWLWVWLVVLMARPRLVIYNISIEELRSVLAEAAAQLDPQARWAGESLSLPVLGVLLHMDGLTLMRNVSITSSGSRQNLDGWQRLARALNVALTKIRVQSNPRAVGLLLAAALMFLGSLVNMLRHPLEVAQAMREVFQY
jgi:hypothetical protein